MKLEKIKLAGFKSFVDPTTVPFPSNLVGIIGPNGCGKSNVIDAVRWVMGESSAKHLRGESMADVIFNGSGTRKPVGNASVELIFDNTDNSAGGQYASYNHISVKRQLSRDGQSQYFMNGVRCRRRDITDLFLGTGLGPRSYSIIEQGMISRLIEAKPEELRVFLEEAAGISKYKDRRKETESRIGHARENLERLNDVRDEVAKQLKHLERQAATAERYKTLKHEERQYGAELLLLKLLEIEEDLGDAERKVLQRETAQEGVVAEQRRLEAEIDAKREQQNEASDALNLVQDRHYSVGTEIARLEESIRQTKTGMQRQRQELEEAERARQQAEAEQAKDQAQIQELEERLAESQLEAEELQELLLESEDRLSQAEQDRQTWQAGWERFNQDAAQPARVMEVERTRIGQLDRQITQMRERLERLNQEREGLDDSELREQLEELAEHITEAELAAEELQEQGLEIEGQVEQARARVEQASQQRSASRSRHQQIQGRLASLETLQRESGNSEKGLQRWLADHQLDSAQRLASQLQVEPEWQRAVEVVLEHRLHSVCVDDLERFADGLERFESGRLDLVEPGREPAHDQQLASDSLAGALDVSCGIAWLLAKVRRAPDLAGALAKRGELAADESWITQDGTWVGPNWLRRHRLGGIDGVLAREQELRTQQAALAETESELTQIDTEHAAAREALAELERRQKTLRGQADQANRELAEARRAQHGLVTRSEAQQQRGRQIEQELAHLAESHAQAEQELAAAREALAEAELASSDLESRRGKLSSAREDHERAVRQTRAQLDQIRLKTQQVQLTRERDQTALAGLAKSLERGREQTERLLARHGDLVEQLEEGNEPLAEREQTLAEQLAVQLSVEAELKDARRRLGEIDEGIHQLDKQRKEVERQIEAKREELDKAKLGRQELQIRLRTLAEQLEGTGMDRQALLQNLADGANAPAWQEKLTNITQRIQRLGAVNLAAIDELREQTERMSYLDSQHADISQSLATLEDAIRKIDRETRTRFKETFDHVNAGIKEMFPKLFGGGHAYLELVGDDLLEAGVAIMARPPGKKVGRIQLLSGGEKALSALSLVFAIFQLNPAPFCMLDEVDAPLDDANTGRYAEMVKEMSDKVQFIFITHNKITMEAANQLAGVTMHEPGVSRLVSVDLEEATKLVA